MIWMELMVPAARRVVCRLPIGLFAGGIVLSQASPVWAEAAEPGVSTAMLMRGLGIVVGLAAIVMLVLVEFVWRNRLTRQTYCWLLLMGAFVAPVLVVPAGTVTVFEETKAVRSCAECHVMDPFVDDMRDPNSSTLAARHFRNKWIPQDQCYACHTTYGAHGKFEAKRDGFRHWLLYVTGTWPEPIEYKGSYPNSNCFTCHENTPKYDRVDSHRLLADQLRNDEVSCVKCHGPPHPVPSERKGDAAHAMLTGHPHRVDNRQSALNADEISALQAYLHEHEGRTAR